MQSFVRAVQYQVASDARDPPGALYPRLGNVFSVVAPIARGCSNLGVESLAAFHLIRGVAEGMQLGVLTGGRGTLPFGFPAVLVPTPPFARQVDPPISIPHAKLSLVPSQIIELVAASRPLNLNHPARRSTSALRPAKRTRDNELTKPPRKHSSKCAPIYSLFLR
jgi:hypothetical protein